MREVIDECIQKAKDSGKFSAVIIGTTARMDSCSFVIAPNKESDKCVGSSFIIRNYNDFKAICQYADGKADYFFIDAEAKIDATFDLVAEAGSCIKRSKMKTFKGNDITALACDLLVSEMIGDLRGKKVSIIGAGNIGSKMALKSVERGANVFITRRDDRGELIAEAMNTIKNRYSIGRVYSEKNASKCADKADVLIGFTQGYPVIDEQITASLSNHALIIDGGVGTITEGAIACAKQLGLTILRLDIRIAFPYVMDSILSTEHFIEKIAGTITADDGTYVAGGYIGGIGDIVVDQIHAPTKIIGIADGKGGIQHYHNKKFNRNK
ncbi:NAD(P)-binding domain-containing protein [Paenibacillus chungangensis]|uniref:NAD(P)-binding domain-containing protein n=1 Tax=Paenibacillus chungangensis TaxID=696535 RepID=A0ABW3HLD0_9BACL